MKGVLLLEKEKAIFIKLVSENHYNDFIKNGEIFFGDSERYRKIETEEANKWIGDKNDSHISYSKEELNRYKINLISNDKKVLEIPLKDFVEINGEAIGYSVHVSIFCCVLLFLNDLKDDKSRQKFINDMNKTLLSDERYMKKIVLITNPEEFFNRIYNKALKDDYDIVSKRVKYVKNQQSFIKKALFSSGRSKFSESHDDIVFSKDDIFKVEREFRSAIYRKNENSFINIKPYPKKETDFDSNYMDIKLSIGSLEDITMTFDNIEDLINSIKN